MVHTKCLALMNDKTIPDQVRFDSFETLAGFAKDGGVQVTN